MIDHASTKARARDLIGTVLAADCACGPGDLRSGSTTIAVARLVSGRRRYPLLDHSLLIVTTGHGVALAANAERLGWLRERLAHRERDEIFAATTIAELSVLVARDEQVIIGPTVAYACSRDTFRPSAVPSDAEFAIVEGDGIAELYAYRGFNHALAYQVRGDGERRDRSAAVARRDGELIGVAACSDDAEALWQIGVDVVPAARGTGLGRALVGMLTERIMAEGAIPFYTAATSNIASRSLALGLGYWPAWTALRAAPSPASE